MKQERLQYLLKQWVDDAGTEAEETELKEIISEGHHENMVVAVLQEFVSKSDTQQNSNDWRSLVKEILEVDKVGSELTVNRNFAPVHRVHFLKTTWFRYAAAVIILLGIGAYLWNIQQKEKPLITTTKPVPVKNDVAPGSTKATLTLSDGRRVELTPETKTIAETGINIENANGRLEYRKAEKAVFNTMSTPRGGQYQLTLPDGTNVWLNAASSITYPTAFVSNTREVSITGEAYFEVRKNPSKPFIVKTPKEDITVLGTSFNVNAYEDELAVKTSLLEGIVKVGDTNIKPGQAYQNGKVLPTDVTRDVAWKNGAFIFSASDLRAVMRQLARWYDIEVKYEGKGSNDRFSGKLSRNLPLSQVLEVLSSFNIKTRLEGKTLIVE